MRQPVDPKIFGLHHSARIEQTGRSEYALVIRRKSRIIMKDGENILEKADRIKAHIPNATVYVQTTAPVCTKTRAFLRESGIRVDNG